MIARKSSKFIVLLSVLFICTCLPLISQADADPVGYEPNNDFTNAKALTKGAYSGLTLNSTDTVDYYKITLNAGDNMSVILWGMLDWADLELFDPLQNKISGSYNSGSVNDTVILLPAPTTGDYYIKVFQLYSMMPIGYNLDIATIIDDALEENDNLATAPTLVKGSYGNLALWDSDYYNISLSAGDNLTAQVTRVGGSGYFDLILIAPNGTEIQSMRHFSTYTLGNIVLLNALTTGLYCVNINRSSGGSGNYSLLLADANDDIFEDNDGFATAALLTKSSISYGNLTLFDDDYYNVSLTANENISVYLTHTTGIGAFNMSLFSIDQTTELWYSNNIGSGHRVIAAHVPSSGAYTVRIRAVGNAWGNYSLSLGNLTDDAFEHNDSLAAAAELTMDTTYSNLHLFDADAYKVFLTAGQNMSFYFTETGSTGFKAGTTNISLYAPDQATILFKVENLDLDSYSYYYSSASLFTTSVSTTGFYYLLITPNQYSCADYYQIQVGKALDDRYEDNDIVGTAAELVKFTNYYLALFDDDFFKISLATGDSLRVLLTRAGGPGTFGVTIYGPDSLTILNSTANIEANGVGDARVMSVDKSGYYIIKVRSYTGAYGNYTLIIGNVYSTTAPGGIAGFPIEWVLLWGSGVLVVIYVWNSRKSMKYRREGV